MADDIDRPSSASSEGSAFGSGDDQERTPSFFSPPRSPVKSVPPVSPLRAPGGRSKRSRTTSTSTNSHSLVRYGSRTIYTAGRPPWYNSQGQLKDAFVIGICGGSASGKTTVAKRIIEDLDVQWVSLLSMDSFYKVLTPEQHEQAGRNEYNFDHPDAFDYALLNATLKRLKEGKHVQIPVYNFTTHGRDKIEKTIYGANVVIFEGILAFANKELLKLLDLKIFVDTDSDIRLARRLKRDISERGRDIAGVLKQYEKFVKPAMDHYIAPTMSCADIIVPRGGENAVAIDLIIKHVHKQLFNRGHRLRSQLVESTHIDQPHPATLHLLHETQQIKGLHTFIRNQNTSKDEFIFYSNRLMRLLIEFALSMLPFKQVMVDTPQGIPYQGKRVATERNSNIKLTFRFLLPDINQSVMVKNLDATHLGFSPLQTGLYQTCGVSILRAGETMEPSLCEVCKDIRLGKILIQTNLDTGEPELHYLRLPKDIKENHVLLMDATVATGAASIMAIRVLLDHDVPEENIMLLSLIMAESGVHSVAYAFPKVKLVTTAIDKEVNEKFYILPGIGNFGDRYFGTEPTFEPKSDLQREVSGVDEQ